MRKLTYLVAVSLDGFICGPRGELAPFESDARTLEGLANLYPEMFPTPFRAGLGISEPNRNFDTVIMGRATYEVGTEQGLMSPYEHLEQYVVSTTMEPNEAASCGVHVVASATTLVRSLKGQAGLGIWLCGGGSLAGTLLEEIDELVIKRFPVLLGSGVPMIAGGFRPQGFSLVESTGIGPVTVEHYRRAALAS